MRRNHIARTPKTRLQLAFEPLESRELLAADVGFDWWSAVDSTVDDWSWTFDDSSSFGTGGEAWWDDSWWADDVSWDSSVADGTDYGAIDYGGGNGAGWDAGGVDWSMPVGGPDAGWTGGVDPVVDVVTPPAPDVAGDMAHDSSTVVDVVSPPSSEPVPAVVIVTPGVESSVEPSTPIGDLAVPPAVAEPDAEGTDEPPVVSPTPILVCPDFHDAQSVIVDCPPAIEGGTATDETSDAGDPVVDTATIDVTDDMTDGSWVIDWEPTEGTPSETPDDNGAPDDAIVNDTADAPYVPPTVVIVAPNADRPSPAVVVPVVPLQSVATDRTADRFAGLGAIFFQTFGRPAGDADGSLAGGPAEGQPGSGRPRLRLPFRPIA